MAFTNFNSFTNAGGLSNAIQTGFGVGNLVGLPTPGGYQSKVQFLSGKDVFQIDCTLKETHSRESPSTDFEVENGSQVSDHITLKPITLDLTGYITDTPFSLINTALTTVASSAIPNIGLVGGSAGIALGTMLFKSSSPSIQAYQKLMSYQSSKTGMSVLTSLFRYENMYIQSLSVPKESSTGEGIQFDLKLKQLTLVTAKTVSIQAFKDPDVAASKTNVGKQELDNPYLKDLKSGINDITSAASKLTPTSISSKFQGAT